LLTNRPRIYRRQMPELSRKQMLKLSRINRRLMRELLKFS